MAFWAMLKASAVMTLRNRQMLFWAFLFPVLLMALLGVAFSGGGSPMSVRLGVVLLSASSANGEPGVTRPEGAKMHAAEPVERARELLKRPPAGLPATVIKELRHIEALSVKTMKGRERAETSLKKGELDALLIIPEDWAEASLSAPSASPATPESAVTPADIIISGASLGKGDAAASMVRQVVGEIEQKTSGRPVWLPMKTSSVEGAAQQSYLYFLLPGVIAMSVMTAGIVGLSSAIVSWRNEGILRRIRLTPLPLWQFLGARVTTQLALSIGQAMVLLLIGRFVFGIHFTGSIALWLPLIVVGSLAFITVGFTLSAFANSVETMGAVSNVVTLPMLFLGGVFFPMDSAPFWLKPIIALIPLKYLADGLREVMIQGQGLYSVGLELGVLSAITVVFFALSVKLFRWD